MYMSYVYACICYNSYVCITCIRKPMSYVGANMYTSYVSAFHMYMRVCMYCIIHIYTHIIYTRHIYIHAWHMGMFMCINSCLLFEINCQFDYYSAAAIRYNTLQHTATHCNTLQHTALHCNTLQHTATHCNTLQHTATHCNTLQHTEEQ